MGCTQWGESWLSFRDNICIHLEHRIKVCAVQFSWKYFWYFVAKVVLVNGPRYPHGHRSSRVQASEGKYA